MDKGTYFIQLSFYILFKNGFEVLAFTLRQKTVVSARTMTLKMLNFSIKELYM